MTDTKSPVLLIFCLASACVYAQNDAVEPDNSSEINSINPNQESVEKNPEKAAEEPLAEQLDKDGEAAKLQETGPESGTGQTVNDLRLPDSTESSGPDQATTEEITLDLFESRSTYRNYMDAKLYPKAVEVAVHALRLSEEEFGRENIELSPVLNELGLALLYAKQPEIAVQHFERSIGLIEDNKGIFSADLVDPLTGMGLAMQQMENHSGAINLFLRSQHVIHRDRGVIDLSQTNIMDMLTRSLLADDRLSDAENVQEAILKIHKMNYGADSGRMAKPMMSLANWQRRYGLLTNSRYLYRSSIELRLDYLDPDSIAMKPVLAKLGLRYFDLMAPSWMKGYRFSDDVIDALTIHRSSLSSEDHVLSYLAVGDQLILFGEAKQAQKAYSKAWILASPDQNSPIYRGKYFDAPTILNDGAGMGMTKMQDIDKVELAYAKFSFTLGPSGQPSRLKVVESNLGQKFWKLAKRNFRKARFRPVIRDGEVQPTHDVSWRRVYPRGRQIDPARDQNAYAWLMTHSSYSHLTR